MNLLDLVAPALFLLFMGSDPAVAILAWLFFVCFLKPDNWRL